MLTFYYLSGWLLTMPLIAAAAMGAVIVTFYEFFVGVVVNLRLGWDVWDYSAQPFNLFGQICLMFSALWFLLSIPAAWLCEAFRRRLDGETRELYGTDS